MTQAPFTHFLPVNIFPQRATQQPQQQTSNNSSLVPINNLNSNENKCEEARKAHIFFNKKDYESAVKFFQLAFEKTNNTDFLAFIAVCYHRVSSLKNAMDTIKKAISLNPNVDKYYAFAGKTCVDIYKNIPDVGFVHQAADFFSTAYQIEPSVSNTRNYLTIRKFLHKEKVQKKQKEFDELHSYLDSLASSPNELLIEEVSADGRKLDRNEIKRFLKNPTVEEEKSRTEIPSFMEDVIGMEVFRDPVTTSSGNTFERENIVHHCKKNGLHDPLTRKEIKNSDELFPNRHLRRMVTSYHLKHPSSFKPDEDLVNLEFVKFS